MEEVLESTMDKASSDKSPFVDASGVADRMVKFWSPFKVSREDIEAEAERLKLIPKPENGRRRSYIVHPESKNNSITPAIRAAIEVVMPGETVEMLPRNSSCVCICIEGSAEASIDSVKFSMKRHDTWSVPSMAVEKYANTGDTPHVRLVFSDEPVLEFLCAYYIERNAGKGVEAEPYSRDPMADFIYTLPTGGGALKTYHAFVDPEFVEQKALIWRWDEVKAFLNQMEKNTEDLRAAIITMYWNPATGRTHGSTNTITAWMSGGIDPKWTEDAPWDMARSHRHNIAAMNYAIQGEWRTIVDGQEFLWGAGDLCLTAPSGAAHSNGRRSREAYTFAIQDNALLAAMNSAILQEYSDRQALHVGARTGFHA